jgi:hypothetical protein
MDGNYSPYLYTYESEKLTWKVLPEAEADEKRLQGKVDNMDNAAIKIGARPST